MSFAKQPRPDADHERPVPDLSALDAALRDVIAAAREGAMPTDAPLDLPETEAEEIRATLEAVSRAASTIDQLVDRNRALTDAAVRSVEYFRQEAAQARAEADVLRAEAEALREENEALKAAAIAHADELELELAARTRDLESARRWMSDLRAHVEALLGNVETRLAETKYDHFFDDQPRSA